MGLAAARGLDRPADRLQERHLRQPAADAANASQDAAGQPVQEFLRR